MTDKEKAIVMAHTGICMLTGDKFQIFHKYVEDIMGRPIMTHEIGFLEGEIKEKTKADFIALCTDESCSENLNRWITVSERLPEESGEYLITWTGILGEHGEKRTKPLLGIAEYEIYEPENYEDWITTENEFEHYRDIKVSAWMPLPEPYMTESEE